VLVLLLVILLAVAATMFATDNMQHVELSLVVGRPVHVRLFFLLLISFMLGCFSAMLINLYRRAKPVKRRERAQDEDDDFFSS
jgi:uncharacterized integral membrane protein